MTTDVQRRQGGGGQAFVLTTVTVVVVLVAAFCLVLSYHGLYELALAKGPAGSAGLAWMWPVVPDGLLIVGAGAVLHYEITGYEDDTWRGWLMVAAGTLISISAQASIAGDTTLGGLLVAGAPPTVLAIVWAFLMGMIRRAVKPKDRRRTNGQARARTGGAVADARQGSGQRTGQGREVDGRRTGNGDASPNTVGIGGVGAAGAVTGRPDGQLRTLDEPTGRTVTGHSTPEPDRSDPDRVREERRTQARAFMAAEHAAGRDLPSGGALARRVGDISARTGQRWKDEFARELAEREARHGLRAVD